MKKSPPNQFVIHVQACLPHMKAKEAMQWINQHFTGKPTVPLDVKCSMEHQNAHQNLMMCRQVKLTFETDVDGNWKLLRAEL